MLELTPAHWLGYSIGGLAMLVEWRSYQTLNETAFRRWSACGALLWAVQYLLLDAWTAGLTIAATAIRTLLSSHPSRSQQHALAIGFTALFATLTLFSWQGWMSLLPAFAVINTTLALFYLNNRSMRIALLFSSIAWLGNDVYWRAWPALLAESVSMVINSFTIRKLSTAPSKTSHPHQS